MERRAQICLTKVLFFTSTRWGFAPVTGRKEPLKENANLNGLSD